LAKLTGDERYERFAVTVLRLAASQMRKFPQGFGRVLSALEFYLGDTKEVVIIGGKGSDMERAVLEKYLPNAVVILSNSPETEASTIPLLKDRVTIGGKTTAYVCENFVCQRPVATIEELTTLI
jgi:uncharacterized protein YyaL (SSP411 family)